MGKPSKWLRALMLNIKCYCFVRRIKNHKNHHTNSASSTGVPTTIKVFSGGGDATYVAEVPRISGGNGGRQLWAAVKIQSHFRAYLSRRALRALKSLVKLQALVRGHIVRKQTAYNIQKLHALLRVQARALSKRTHISQSLPYTCRSYSDGKTFAIHLDHLNIFQHPEDGYYYTILESTKIDCSRSSQCSFSEHPNYMADTESSRAKMRSLSAPKQRTQYERSSSISAIRREY